MSTPGAVAEQELDRLEVLLDDPALAEAMRLDEIQAYLCAALSGPQPATADECLTAIFGESADSPVLQEASAVVRRIAAHLDAQLGSDAPFALWLYPSSEDEDAPMDYAPWCMAYLQGVDEAIEDWFDALDDEEAAFLDERLYPLIVLTGEAETAAREHGEKWPEGEELAALMKECEEEVPTVIEEIHRFWMAKRGGPTVRRESPKVGRNDPCPCNSGKKFKQCCGA